MDDSRKTYYIWIPNGQIFQDQEASPWNFKIEANEDEIIQLREYFDLNHSADQDSFYRAHVPYIQYHYDRENDLFDDTLKKVYEVIHRLGDEEARSHIESMGILQDKPIDSMVRPIENEDGL